MLDNYRNYLLDPEGITIDWNTADEYVDCVATFGTDAIATDLPRLREPWKTIQPHPRHYGPFPRVFAKYVREEHALELPEAVRRMTGLAADHFGLEDRRDVREGCWADLVVLNPVTAGERATWRWPNEYPSGIEHVFVNGEAAVSDGRCTGALGGHMLGRGE